MSKTPDAWASLSKRLAKLEERLGKAERKSPYFNTGLSPDGAGGLTLQGVPLEPLISTVARCSGSGFALSTSPVEKAFTTFTVPTGCTRLKATCFGRLYAVNANTTGGSDTKGSDAIYVKVGIESSLSIATPTGISGGNGYATTVGFDVFEFSGLTPGSTLRLTVQGSSGIQAIPAYVDNYATGVASLMWLR